MSLYMVILIMTWYLKISSCAEETFTTNLTGPKDMYVVRATVYQVGILSNRTNETAEPSTNRQEAITIYRNKGSSIDLSNIHDPLLTNITAEKLVGVAPVSNATIPWNTIKHLVVPQGNVKTPGLSGIGTVELETEVKKSKRDVLKTPMEIERGAAVIPSEAGVHSIALPPLITFNKNFSKIPVPIPNMSVVSYAKVNTLVHSP